MNDSPTSVAPPVARAAATPGSGDCRGGTVTIIDFHRDGNSGAHRSFGWSGQEQTHVWSLQGSCGLSLPPRTDDRNLVLEVDVGVCLVDTLITGAVLTISVNGRPIASALVRRRTILRCRVPDGVVRPGEPIELRFDHPNYVRLAMVLSNSYEDRVLGVSFHALYVYPAWFGAVIRQMPHRLPDEAVLDATPWTEPAFVSESDRIAYRFGPDDAGAAHLVSGWRHDQDGNAWSDGRTSRVHLPAPATQGAYYARIAFSPIYIRSKLTTQRITVLLNGCVIGQFRTGCAAEVSLPLPREAYQDHDVLEFTFVLPDGFPMHRFDASAKPYFFAMVLREIDICPVPAGHAGIVMQRHDDVTVPVPIAQSARFLDQDIDALILAVKDECGVAIADLFPKFESLGDNCAFGLAQRKGGAEVLGLLRFANTPLPRLAAALADEFRAVTKASELRLWHDRNVEAEWELYADRYGIRWHTGLVAQQADEATTFAQQSMRLTYLRRKFFETLRGGRKILTISRAEPRKHALVYPHADERSWWEEKPEPLRQAEMVLLFLKLNQYGTNTLLFLTRCEHGRHPGTVDLMAPGLMRGYVDDFVITGDTTVLDHVTWMRIVVNAWLLDQGPNAGFRQRETP
jgi:hypothetical protein